MIFKAKQGCASYVLPIALTAILLVGCGGGGGGGSSSGAASAGPEPVLKVLSFSAPVATATVQEGSSSTMSLNATVTTPSDFQNVTSVFAYVVDSVGVILPDARITQQSATRYSVMLQSAPTLGIGKHTGSFLVKVCKDAACAQQFPGSPMQLPYDITVTPVPLVPMTVSPTNSLSLTISAGKPAPAPIAVAIAAKSRTWTVSTTADWIKLATTTGTGDGSFTVAYDLSLLKPEVQTGTIVVTSSEGQIVSLQVSAQLLPAAFSVERGQINFNAINGAPIADEPVKFTVADGAASWSATTDAAWLNLTPTGGTTPGITSLKVDPSKSKLASGPHNAKLTISAPNMVASVVPVTLTLAKATLKASTSSITLGGTYGRDTTTPANLTLDLNTMTNAFPWTLSALPTWLGASATSGMLNQAGSKIVLSQISANLPVGTSTTTLTATAQVNGDTITAPVSVTVNRDTHKLLFSEVGIGLSSTPDWSRLSRTVTVRDNFGQAPVWAASSDKTWLSVQRIGNALTLTANPAALPVDTISYATVSLAATDSAIQTTETLQVAIWKGSQTPTAMTKVSKTYTHLKTDPIRPLLYANNGGSGIDVYNVYTATQVGTIADLGASLGNMTISPNGQQLYTYDTANRNIIVVDLATMAKKASWPMTAATNQSSALLAIRPNGVEILIAADSQAYLGSTGAVLGKTGYGDSMAASADGTRLYTQNTGYSPATVNAFALDYSSLGGGALFNATVARASDINGSSNGQDIAVSADGTRLYVASGAPYRCSSVKPSDLTFIGSLPGGDAYPTNVDVGSDGRVYCGISGSYSSADVWVHSAEGVMLKSFKIGNLFENTMNISADGLILLAQINSPGLMFVPVGP